MTENNNNLYLGSRGVDFKHLIMKLLQRGKLKAKYIDKLTDKAGMKAYGQAFTASSAHSEDNYERFEQIGDMTANKFIVWYSYKRFPQLDCTKGVKVVARLRINYGAKDFFAPLGEKLGFWPFISAAEDGSERNKYYRSRNKKDLLEDCIESFIGCTEYLLDKQFRPGVGYGIVYSILENVFDEIPMSLKYEDLYDPKTRLKETFDIFKQLGSWYFLPSRETGEGTHSMAKSLLYRIPANTTKNPVKVSIGTDPKDYILQPQKGWSLLGEGIASKKGDAQQKAAEQGINLLRNNGFYKEPPNEYKFFCKS